MILSETVTASGKSQTADYNGKKKNKDAWSNL